MCKSTCPSLSDHDLEKQYAWGDHHLHDHHHEWISRDSMLKMKEEKIKMRKYTFKNTFFLSFVVVAFYRRDVDDGNENKRSSILCYVLNSHKKRSRDDDDLFRKTFVRTALCYKKDVKELWLQQIFETFETSLPPSWDRFKNLPFFLPKKLSNGYTLATEHNGYQVVGGWDLAGQTYANIWALISKKLPFRVKENFSLLV